MASTETIKKGLRQLHAAFPYFAKDKSPEQLQYITAIWLNGFKKIPDGRFVEAVALVIQSAKFFPDFVEMSDKVHRVELIESQRLVTYFDRLAEYERLKSASPEEVDTWVDMMRFIHPTEAFTTKTFKERVEIARKQVVKAYEGLREDQKEGIKNV